MHQSQLHSNSIQKLWMHSAGSWSHWDTVKNHFMVTIIQTFLHIVKNFQFNMTISHSIQIHIIWIRTVQICITWSQSIQFACINFDGPSVRIPSQTKIIHQWTAPLLRSLTWHHTNLNAGNLGTAFLLGQSYFLDACLLVMCVLSHITKIWNHVFHVITNYR